MEAAGFGGEQKDFGKSAHIIGRNCVNLWNCSDRLAHKGRLEQGVEVNVYV